MFCEIELTKSAMGATKGADEIQMIYRLAA